MTEKVNKIFPEPKESDDMKIKKAILNHFKKMWGNCQDDVCGVHVEDAIAWLEKQGKEEYELKSFKDEDVRKFMQYIEKQAKAYEFNLPNRSYDIYAFAKDILVWLEKQSEQESSQINERAWLYLISDVLTWKDGIGQYLDDPRVQELSKRLCSEYAQKLYNPSNTGKNEPKFKVGDWVVNKFGDSWHIVNLDKKNYQVSDGKGNYNYFPISKQDEMHLWTIQDAKYGDVLANDHHILILKELVYDWSSNGTPFITLPKLHSVKAYCGIKPNGNFEIGKDNWCFCGTLHILPATKEQRDLLFQKMKEADYEWDADKKELKKLVKPKFKVGDKIFNKPRKYMGASGTQGTILEITKDNYYVFTDGSYVSIDNQDSWELLTDKKPKFDPKTLQPFDKVLVRDSCSCPWKCAFYSHTRKNTIMLKYVADNAVYEYCIPYNDETKHLVGTTDEAPEYYRYF